MPFENAVWAMGKPNDNHNDSTFMVSPGFVMQDTGEK
jgi:hypothetical protein